MSEKMKFAIVGAGVIAPFHAKAITQNPNAELEAIADVEPAKAEKLAGEYGPADESGRARHRPDPVADGRRRIRLRAVGGACARY